MPANNQPATVLDEKENQRRTANAIRIGTVVEARYDSNKDGSPPADNLNPYFHNKDVNGNYRGPLYRVEIGQHKTYWIPQMHNRCHNDQEYWAYEVGEQVLLLCDAGDPMQSIIIGALPTDANRPPVGHDDLSHDLRPWRPSVHRLRYQDGCMTEYDRFLHRRLTVFNDGSLYTDWLLDDRQDRAARNKETQSDLQGVPPRHWRNRHFADGTDHEFLWDEHVKVHRKHWRFPDIAIFEYEWDEENQLHTEHVLYADGTDYFHCYDEQGKTHQQKWAWPDGRVWDYWWDENALNHHETLTHADGTVQRYHWNAEQQSVHETQYADGTQMIFQFKAPHHLQINFADGSHLQYDLTTHHLDVKVVGTVKADIEGDTDVTCHANVTAKVDGMARVEVDGNTDVICHADATMNVDGKLTATAGNDINVQSGTNVILSAPYITLNGTGMGKNVQFNGNFGFNGQVSIDGSLSTTETITAKERISSERSMQALIYIESV